MAKLVKSVILVAALIVVLPRAASAQASLGGVITDTSGAVQPGVTVEASSAALIEKVRSASPTTPVSTRSSICVPAEAME